MTKRIYCYSLDFQKEENSFDSLEELLKEYIGVREQAEKALNNPEMSYRGLRLISEDSLHKHLPLILSNKAERIKNDYVDSITKLESQIKQLEKKERKADVKLDVLKDDYKGEIAKLVTENKKEIEEINSKYDSEIKGIKSENQKRLEAIIEEHKSEVEDLSKKQLLEAEDFAKNLEKYTSDVNEEILRYETEMEKTKNEYNNTLEKMHKENLSNVYNLLEDKNIFISNLSHDLDLITRKVEDLTLIISNIFKEESETTGEDIVELTIKNDRKFKNTSKKKHLYLNKEVEELVNKPVPFTIRKIDLKSEYKKQNKEESMPVETVLENVKSVKNKEINVIVDTPKKVEVVPKSRLYKGLEILTPKEYLDKSEVEIARYIYKMFSKGITLGELSEEYASLTTDLHKKNIVREIIDLAKRDGKTYNEIKDLIELDTKDVVVQSSFSSKREFNLFFGISELPEDRGLASSKTAIVEKTPVEKASDIIKKDPRNKEGMNGGLFDWEAFKNKYTRTEEIKLIFQRESLSLKDASILMNIPPNQIKSMLQVVKTLGHERTYNNESLITPDELMLLLVSDGYLKSSRNIKSKETINLKTMISSLYPSWKQYTQNK